MLSTALSIPLLLASAAAAVQYIELAEGWEHTTRGPWAIRVDQRDLLAMRHPWTPSEEGNYAQATRTVQAPADWDGPVRLGFYVSDDYHTGAVPGTPAADAYTAHRRKQVLVNDALVWSVDVSDPAVPGESPWVEVALPELPESRTLRIQLVAFDSRASAETARGDYYRPPTPGLAREADPDASRFRTTVYWGDLALISGEETLTPRPRPSERRVLARHHETWPPVPDAASWRGKSAALSIAAPEHPPAPGFPLEMGIPFPEGAVPGPGDFRLRRGGAPVHAQKTVESTWPDGSVRWATVRLPVKPGERTVELSFREDTARPPAAPKIRDEGDGTAQVELGSVALALGAGDPIQAVAWKGKPVLERAGIVMERGGVVVPGTADTWRVVEEGPFCTVLAIDGRFEGLDRTHGAFVLYVSAYRDLPWLKLWLRVFNDTATPLNIAHLRLELLQADPPESVTLPHGDVAGDFDLIAAGPDSYRVSDSEQAVDGPFYAQWATGALAVKHFYELFPKGLSRAGNTIALDLFAGGASPITLHPGEAKSHEVWLGLGAVDGKALAAAVAEPPIFQAPEYYCNTGVFGPAAPITAESALARHLAATYEGKTWRELGQSLGLRHFPDSAYLGSPRAWSNNYNGRMMGLWMTWLMTGDRAWFDRATAMCAHLMDVAVAHTEVPGEDWIGAMLGPGPDHRGAPWSPMLRGEGFGLYARLAANPEAHEAFLGVADYCVRSRAGLRGETARHAAAPFATIVAAYRETGEMTFLEAGAERLAAMLKRADRRRGVWLDWHGSESYPGNVPWMAAQLAGPLWSWYEMTGDVEAAQLLVGLAESLICEGAPWEAPGAMATYSPNPRYPRVASLDPFIIPLIAAAGDLTGDSRFEEAARAQWAHWNSAPEFGSVFNLWWHWPWLNSWVAGISEDDAQAAAP